MISVSRHCARTVVLKLHLSLFLLMFNRNVEVISLYFIVGFTLKEKKQSQGNSALTTVSSNRLVTLQKIYHMK